MDIHVCVFFNSCCMYPITLVFSYTKPWGKASDSADVSGTTEVQLLTLSAAHRQGYRGYNAFIWVFPKIEVPQNGWFLMENLIKREMDDVRVPLFLETSIVEMVGWAPIITMSMYVYYCAVNLFR